MPRWISTPEDNTETVIRCSVPIGSMAVLHHSTPGCTGVQSWFTPYSALVTQSSELHHHQPHRPRCPSPGLCSSRMARSYLKRRHETTTKRVLLFFFKKKSQGFISINISRITSELSDPGVFYFRLGFPRGLLIHCFLQRKFLSRPFSQFLWELRHWKHLSIATCTK